MVILEGGVKETFIGFHVLLKKDFLSIGLLATVFASSMHVF